MYINILLKKLMFIAVFAVASICSAQSNAITSENNQTQEAVVATSDNQTQEAVVNSQESAAHKLFTPERIRERGIENAKNLHKRAKTIITFVRENISEDFADFLSDKFLGFRIITIAMALSLLLFGLIIQRFVIAVLFKWLTKKTEGKQTKESTLIVGKLKAPITWIVAVLLLDMACLILFNDADLIIFTRRVSSILFLASLGWLISIIVSLFFKITEEKLSQDYAATKNLLELACSISKYVIITITGLIILDTCGANINAIIASLGIGGAALAFASKDTIANFFGSISIIADRPFDVGDWVLAGGVEGIVEFIGFRSTRIRTFAKSIVTIPNSVLANENIENWSRRKIRRVVMTLGFTYASTPEQLEGIAVDLTEMLKADPRVDKASVMVFFEGFGASSLDVKMIYHIKEMDFAKYATKLQEINVKVMNLVSKKNLSFAFPSKSLYIESMPNLK